MTATVLTATPEARHSASVKDHELQETIASACRRIAPLWPLKHFVAVNPFMGFAGQSFAETCATLNRVTRTRMLMPWDFYRQAMAKGLIDDDALKAALDLHAVTNIDVHRAKELAQQTPEGLDKPLAVVATVAEVLDDLADGDRQVSLVAFMIDEISAFCAAFFDQGQANWPMPKRQLKPYRRGDTSRAMTATRKSWESQTFERPFRRFPRIRWTAS